MNRRADVLEVLELVAGVAVVMVGPIPVVAFVSWWLGF